MKTGKLIIVSAPSGCGKSTLIAHLMACGLNLHFSVSATSRPPRGTERNGVDYFFLSPADFRERIAHGEFVEYEEVYRDRYYGTLKSQVEERVRKGENIVFDVDVNGAMRLKQYYAERALSLFIQPPSIAALRSRLEGRATDAPEVIDQRIERAAYELSLAPKFDRIVVNDNLDEAKAEIERVVSDFLAQ